MAQLNIKLNTMRMGPEAEVLVENLRKRIVGQDEAIREIAGCYQMFVSGLRARGLRPVSIPRLLLDDPPPPGQPIPSSLAGG